MQLKFCKLLTYTRNKWDSLDECRKGEKNKQSYFSWRRRKQQDKRKGMKIHEGDRGEIISKIHSSTLAHGWRTKELYMS